MSRKLYVYRPKHPQANERGMLCIELDDYEAPARVPIVTDRHHEGTCATDGTDIGSWKKRREYMKRAGVVEAPDFKEHWKKSKEERIKISQGDFDHKERREAVERAIYMRNKP